MTEKILILDFGSQVTQLIARRVRELSVYCEIHPFNHIPEIGDDVKGVIFSGSPCSVRRRFCRGCSRWHCYGSRHSGRRCSCKHCSRCR